jgi:hypothetical protein
MTEPWPDDTFDLIFLLRFEEEIGRRVFPDWTGTEVAVERHVVLLPELAWATPYQRRHATELLLKHTDLLARPNPHLGADELFTKRPSLWPIAQKLALPKEAAPALQRLHAVRDEIVQQSRAGKLALKIRRVGGGPWKDYDPDWWNIDRPEGRFRSGIIDPEYPFDGRPSRTGNDDHWIFVPREGSDPIVARLTASPIVILSPKKESDSAADVPVPAQSEAALSTRPDEPVAAASAESPAVPPAGSSETAHKEETAEFPVQLKKRRGAKEQWDWDMAMEYLCGELDKRGDPLDPKEACDGWRSEADAGRLVKTYIVEALQAHLPEDRRTEPDSRTVMRHVGPELDRWRAQKGTKRHN